MLEIQTLPAMERKVTKGPSETLDRFPSVAVLSARTNTLDAYHINSSAGAGAADEALAAHAYSMISWPYKPATEKARKSAFGICACFTT